MGVFWYTIYMNMENPDWFKKQVDNLDEIVQACEKQNIKINKEISTSDYATSSTVENLDESISEIRQEQIDASFSQGNWDNQEVDSALNKVRQEKEVIKKYLDTNTDNPSLN